MQLSGSCMLLLLCTAIAKAYICRPFNDLYPVPVNASSDVFTSASQQLNSTLSSLLVNQTVQASTNSTSFSLNVFSLHDPTSILTYHHSAPALTASTEGVKHVDSSTIYRLGSVSKLWTMYIWLLAAGDGAFNDPITKYVPELAQYTSSHNPKNEVDIVNWHSITVEALASHLSGIGRDPAAGPQGDKLYQQLLGLPPPTHNISTNGFCGDAASPIHFYCNRSDFFTDNLFRAPNTPIFYSPAYANLPFQILAYALENITNTSFTSLFQTNLVDKHNLQHTFYSVPPTPNDSVIPVNASASYYNVDFAESSPFGGYYSSLDDVTTVARAILNSTFLNAALTRKWMKPITFTPPSPLLDSNGIVQAVGAPWEIIRAPAPDAALLRQASGSSNATASASYQTWVYTKEGDIGLYTSLTALLPEFDAGFTVLTAGTAAHVLALNLADLITETFVPAFFEAARSETAELYTGTFVDEITNSSAKIQVPAATAENQGVILSELIHNGTDFLALISAVQYGLPQGTQVEARLYPNRLQSTLSTDGNGESEIEQGWKLSYSVPGESAAAGAFTSQCATWESVGGLNYAGVSFDDLRFRVNTSAAGERTVLGLDLPALQVNMTMAA